DVRRHQSDRYERRRRLRYNLHGSGDVIRRSPRSVTGRCDIHLPAWEASQGHRVIAITQQPLLSKSLTAQRPAILSELIRIRLHVAERLLYAGFGQRQGRVPTYRALYVAVSL